MSLSSATVSSTTTLRMPRPVLRPQPEAAPLAAAAVAAAPVPSDQLMQGRKTIEISHNGSVYRLQATKLGKLILTK